MRFLLYLNLFLFLIGCESTDKKGDKGKSYKNLISYQNQIIWLNDALGCKGERKSIAKSIIKKKSNWQNLDKKTIVELLGSPDNEELSLNCIYYYLENGAQCQNPNYISEASELVFFFQKNNKVSSINIARH